MSRKIALSIEPGAAHWAAASMKDIEALGAQGVEWSADPRAKEPEHRMAGRPRILVLSATCEIFDCASEQVQLLLRRAASCGAEYLNLRFGRGSADGSPSGDYAGELHAVHELLRRVRFDVEASGVQLAVQAVEGEFLGSPIELRDAVDAANCWAIVACIDIATTWTVGRAADWIGTLGRRLCIVRIAPAPGELADRDSQVSQALNGAGFCGCIVLRASAFDEENRIRPGAWLHRFNAVADCESRDRRLG